MRLADALDRFGRELERCSAAVSADRRAIVAKSVDADRVLEAFARFAEVAIDNPIGDDEHERRVGTDIDDDLVRHESGLGGPDDDHYVVILTRQISLIDEQHEYAGMRAVSVELATREVPPDRVPRAQRWGYAGPPRPDGFEDEHPEIANWAGHVLAWSEAVRRSNSWLALSSASSVDLRAVHEDL